MELPPKRTDHAPYNRLLAQPTLRRAPLRPHSNTLRAPRVPFHFHMGTARRKRVPALRTEEVLSMEVRAHCHDMRTHDRGFAVSTPWCEQLVPVEMAVKPHPLITVLLFPLRLDLKISELGTATVAREAAGVPALSVTGKRYDAPSNGVTTWLAAGRLGRAKGSLLRAKALGSGSARVVGREEVEGSTIEGIGGAETEIVGAELTEMVGGRETEIAGGAETDMAGGAETEIDGGGPETEIAGGSEMEIAGGPETEIDGASETEIEGAELIEIEGASSTEIVGGAGTETDGASRTTIAGLL
ncbi:hypothetical protein V495_04294 [Pseudogymnoascus sp. VKM F-4514 (FW-929)]|nr:hypothetical protein V495_04294 [Pseudogymnoascus sp. VKM F-4514 (FW-929)]